jgi:hypothetical protein
MSSVGPDNNVSGEGQDPSQLDDFESDPVLQKYQTTDEQEKWLKELESHRKEREKFNKIGLKAIRRYADIQSNSTNEAKLRTYNLFWVNTNIKTSSLYAQTPVSDTKRRSLSPDDQVARVAALLIDQNIAYELDADQYDDVAKSSVFDWMTAGLGVQWVRYEQIDADPIPVVHPPTGLPIFEQDLSPAMTQPPPVHQASPVDHVNWDDFSWSVSRNWNSVWWVARAVEMTEEDVEARFKGRVDPKVLEEISFSSSQSGGRAKTDWDSFSSMKPKYTTEETAKIFEIWDKKRKLVFWVVDGASTPLDVIEDATEFDGFFPTPIPPLAEIDTSNTTPESDYRHLQRQYEDLDELNERISKLQKSLQLRWLYDAKRDELKDVYQTGADLQGIPVPDWNGFVEEGGIAGSIQFMPLKEIGETYGQLMAARNALKDDINELEGINDMMRAEAMPYETATAVNQKTAFSTGDLYFAGASTKGTFDL